MGQSVEIAMGQTVRYRLIDRRRHCAPGTAKQSRHLLPRQPAGPRRQRHHQRSGHALFTAHPRHQFDMNSFAPRTAHPPRRIAQLHLNPPQWNMPKTAYRARIAVHRQTATAPTARCETTIRRQLSDQPRYIPAHTHYTKPLQFHRLFDEIFNEHESSFGYLDSFATSKYLK